MNEAPSPAWAPGFRPVQINKLPASFVTFFPGRDATTPNISWADHLSAQKPTTRLPAWCRVAVEASASTRRQGLIMKRVSLQRERSAAAAAAAPAGPVAILEEHPHARRRLNKEEQTKAEVKMGGSPLPGRDCQQSDAGQGYNHLPNQLVHVANHYHNHTTVKSVEEMKQLRTGRYYRVIPKKRRQAEEDAFEEREDVTNGNRLRTYAELTNILERAAVSGATEINISMASSAEASAALQQSRRDPRVHLAAQGVPDLSIIVDSTEPPESPVALSKLPGAKSPVKKLAGQSSPIKTPTKRITESMVPLLPGSSPKASPSPTKSSAPSTPFKKSPRTAKPTPSPAGFPKSPVPMQSPLLQPQQLDTPGISSLFESSSKDTSSTMLYPASVRDTPTKQPRRPSAPTPSRWNGPEPGTPYQMFTPRAATPTQTDSPLGLLASLPSYYRSVPSPINPVLVEDPMNINFGPSSPSFTSGSRFQTPTDAKELHRSKNVSKALRRRSEPLARSLHRAKVRRQSMSPQKLPIKSIETIAEDTSDATLPLEDNDDDTVIHYDISNMTTDDASIAEDSTLPTLAKDMSETATGNSPVPSSTITTPTHKRSAATRQSIVEVDMRKNPDIFGTPAPSSNPAIEELARIAEDRCNGFANVVIAQENGRLFVRFKLPTKYASLFPESQGPDESHFSSSPSVSTSPRLRFANAPISAEVPKEPTIMSTMTDVDSSPLNGDRTLIVSDFAASSPASKLTPCKVTITSPVPDTLVKSSLVANAKPSEEAADMSSPDRTVAVDETAVPDVDSPSHIKATKSLERSLSSSPLSELQNTPSLESSTAASISATPAAQTESRQELPVDSATATPITASADVAPPPLADDSIPAKKANEEDQSSAEKKQDDNQMAQSIPKAKLATSKPDDDSPGREYMRDFIKRSRPKRLSTSESGSPIAAPRLPLGVKSPNAESPQRPKRKYDSEDSESGVKTSEEPAPKKARAMSKLPEPKTVTETRSKDMVALSTSTEDHVESEDEVDSDADELSMDSESAPAARRSSRLRGKSTTSKSSIPTPIKIGRGKTTLSSMRNEQQDLSRQTIANTRRNKGKAMSPKRALERLSEEAQEESEEQESDSAAAKAGKGVVWKEPLAVYQEQQEEEQEQVEQGEKPKRGRGAPTAQAKPGPSRVAKPAPKPAPAAQRQRTAAAAARLNRTGNGTPARVTRSRARTQK
ncbi:hypothetical protein PT974_11019 [Cladobotryum mycophilum]|uniref:Uncharacterized protein n=1 Tax=Cladobotryum mycophilum TaxID=491253 RepID=A0ABR0SCZ8_9HYPO